MIYDQSWYGPVMAGRIDGVTKTAKSMMLYDEIVSFERQLTDSGCVVLKFFLHITKKEQKKRLTKLDEDPATRWRVGDAEWKRHRRYQDYLVIIEETLRRTDQAASPWIPIAATDRKFAAVQIGQFVARVLERRIEQIEIKKNETPSTQNLLVEATKSASVLAKIDLRKMKEPTEYETEMARWGRKLHGLHYAAYKKKLPVLVLFEGWDAAGKRGSYQTPGSAFRSARI